LKKEPATLQTAYGTFPEAIGDNIDIIKIGDDLGIAGQADDLSKDVPANA
jgi:hypothetical protein